MSFHSTTSQRTSRLLHAGPDLTIAKTHPNSFGPGQTGVIFILTVTNRGGAPTQGRVDVVDDLPVGLTAKTASGGRLDLRSLGRHGGMLADRRSGSGSELSLDHAHRGRRRRSPGRVHVNQHGHGLGGGDVNPGNNTAEDVGRPVALHAIFCGRRDGLLPDGYRDLQHERHEPGERVPSGLPGRRTARWKCSSCWLRWHGGRVDLNAACSGIGQAVSAMIESDQPVAATRQMTWGDPVYGSTLESGIARTSRTWYFAEGATTIFTVFYLVENPGDTPATVTLTHLLEGGAAPIAHAIVVPPFARGTILVNDVPGLSAADFATIVTSDVPIVAERAMYLNTTNRMWEGGAAGRGSDRAEHVVVVRRRGDGVLQRLSCCWGTPPPATQS